MGRTLEIADNLVKMAESLRYDDFDAKDKLLEYAGKLIKDEFGPTSVYMQKLGLIVFSPKDGTVLGGLAADGEEINRRVFESGAEKLAVLLKEVHEALGGPAVPDSRVIIIQAKDRMSAARMVSHIKAKGVEPLVVKDTEDWKKKLDELI